MTQLIWRAAVAAALVIVLASSGQAQVSLATYVGAVQQSMGRAGHVWALGIGSGGSVTMGLADRWRLRVGLGWSRLRDDTTSTALIKIANPGFESTRQWTTTTLSLAAEYKPELLGHLGSYLTLGLGTATWHVRSYPGDELVRVLTGDGKSADFAATELIALGGFGIEPAILSNIQARIGVQADYYSGIGTSFPDGFTDDRSHFLVGVNFGLAYHFGHKPRGGHSSGPIQFIATPPELSPVEISDRTAPAEIAADVEETVHDPIDVGREDNTSPAIPDESDVIADVEEPQIASSAMVIASTNPQGPTTAELFSTLNLKTATETASEDQSGTSKVEVSRATRDSDGDGISDDCDKCPSTPKGYSVDETGCLRLTARLGGFIVRAAYPSGVTEPDKHCRLILEDLAIRLNDLPSAVVTIEAFTDNIGTDLDNLLISQKRATKIKDYLVKRGITSVRINAVGRGEADPIASNGTASGRRRNRRIEISYKLPGTTSASTD